MILLDTHVLVWMVADSKRLSKSALGAIRAAQREGGLGISAISLWELAWLVGRGRIQAYGTVEASVRLLIEGVIVRPITPEIAAVAAQYPVRLHSQQVRRAATKAARHRVRIAR